MLFASRATIVFQFMLIISSLTLFSNYSWGIEPDSCIWIVTNRTKNPENENGSFFGSQLDTNGTLRFLKACYCHSERWIYQLRTDFSHLIKDMPENKDILLNVHGDHKTFDEASERGLEISNAYDVSVILFNWPSKLPNSGGVKNFRNSQKNIRESAPMFYEFLKLIEKYKKKRSSALHGNHISLFHHSLGNYYLQRLVEDPAIHLNLHSDLVDNLILNAAAVNARGHMEWLEQLNFQKRTYVIFNKQDFNLNGLRIFSKEGPQLGERLQFPLAENTVYINLTEIVGFRTPTGTSHTYFIGEVPEEIPNIRQLYQDLFHGKQIYVRNPSMFKINREGLGYDLIEN